MTGASVHQSKKTIGLSQTLEIRLELPCTVEILVINQILRILKGVLLVLVSLELELSPRFDGAEVEASSFKFGRTFPSIGSW